MNQKQTEQALTNSAIPSAPVNSVVADFQGKPISQKALFAMVILFVSGCNDWRGTDTVEARSEKPSPNGKFIATSFYCQGGGAAGYCYNNASLRRAGDDLNQRDGLLGKHKTWKGFSDIELRWIDDSNLEVSYRQDTGLAYRDHNSVRVESKHGITIHYIVNN